MRIYTRAEWGAVPPKAGMPRCKKEFFIIHHTASGNGILTLDQEKRQQRAWQVQHMGAYTNYKGKDILQGFSVFQSGRIFEGRIPWDADNGAAYSAHHPGFGIEVDGTFVGGKHIGPAQYDSLVWLCAEAHKRVGVPLTFYGHRQLGFLDVRNSTTACPGNLLEDLIINDRLKNDVRRLLLPKQEEKELAIDRKRLTAGQDDFYSTWIKGNDVYLDVVGIGDSEARITFTPDGEPFRGNETAKVNTGDVARYNLGQLFDIMQIGGVVFHVECLKGAVVLKYTE